MISNEESNPIVTALGGIALRQQEDIDELLQRIEQLENDSAIANDTIANFTSFIRQTHVLIGALLENRSPDVLRGILDERYDDIMVDAVSSHSVSG
jgi:hypothetical protein